jgi:TorA maturation chaperone TorD
MHGQKVRKYELCQARAKLYQLLSTLYFQPHRPELLRFLSEWVSAQVEIEDSYNVLPPEMQHGLSLMHSFFRNAEEKSWQEMCNKISMELTKLFRGVKKEYSPPPPYESVYCEESGRAFGERTMEVYRQYRHFGYNLVDELKHEPPDHISFELEFMHLMCSREAEAWQKDDEQQAIHFQKVEREFCQKHLLTWISRLRDQIIEFDSFGFFRGLSELMVG